MELLGKSDSEHVAEFASMLLRDWMKELEPGQLRDRLLGIQQDCLAQLPRTDHLTVALHEQGLLCVSGYVEVEGRAEFVGPYVARKFRNQGIGSWLLRATCWQAVDASSLCVLAPLSAPWIRRKLERLGFTPAAASLAEDAGGYLEFRADPAERATTELRNAGEPRGAGPWKVVVHNNNEASFRFVADTLAFVLDIQPNPAFEYALLIHRLGSVPIRYCRTRLGASRIVKGISEMAAREGVPLHATVELCGDATA